MPACISVGTVEASVDQPLIGLGTTKVTIIDVINNNILIGSPLKLELFIKLASDAATTFPIFVSLKMLINVETANIITRILPIPFRE